jgi:hypothetical protein
MPPRRQTVTLVVIAISLLVIFILNYWERSTILKTTEGQSVCPLPSPQSHLRLEFYYWNWNWQYLSSNGLNYQLKCPSNSKNVAFFSNGRLVASTEHSIFEDLTFGSTHILDCNGQLIFKITRGGMLKRLINRPDILVEDADSNPVAFIKATTYFTLTSDYTVTNPSGNIVAEIKLYLISGAIDIHVVNLTDAAVDPRILGLFFTQDRFTRQQKKTDFCNIASTYSVVFFVFLLGFLLVPGFILILSRR